MMPCGMPTGALARAGLNGIAFVIQSFHRRAGARGREGPGAVPTRTPRAVRRSHGHRPRIQRRADPATSRFDAARMRGVLELVAREVGLGQDTAPKGTGMGVAFHFSHRGHFAEVVQATVDASATKRVDKVWVAGDVGSQIINPLNAENQVQGAVLDGLADGARQEITIENGRAVQSNFHDFPLLRMRAGRPGRDPLQDHRQPTHRARRARAAAGGAGPVQRDLRRCGKRVRSLPLSKHDLKWG